MTTGGDTLNRSDKENTVAILNKKFSDVHFVSLVDYKGLDVSEISSLRHELRSANTDFRVIKNSLAKRAIKGTTLEQLVDYFLGPTAVALTNDDPVAPAKILTRFAKENPKLEFKVGLLDGKSLSEEDLSGLAKLPPREILLATLLGTLKSPSSGLVNLLAGVMRKFLGTLQAIEQEKATSSAA